QIVASQNLGASPRRPVRRPVQRLSAAGEGAFTDTNINPQAHSALLVIFFSKNQENKTRSTP
ncbi:hypothetical protein KUW09_00005, partial [Mameliella alba]|nr:hypothetical protein [Antarctobacter heliothermus]MBY6142396.1 hypothetical protein [Mameliella alba]MCA0953879.1 hypothetical protein [Mameliella alba]